MEIKKIVFGMIAVVAAFVGQAESSAPFRLSLKSDGVRTSLGDETLTYSSQWDGGDGETVTIAENAKVLLLGGLSCSLNGQYDEIRLRGGALSADRIKADYDMIVNRNFLRYGAVENGKGVVE